MIFYKCHGAGNDFLVADNRGGDYVLAAGDVRRLCDRHTGFGADGLMLLENSPEYDFRMVYYNPDGSTGMMCGNGGRCIVAFAALSGIDSFTFEAADGVHEARIISREGQRFVVRLKMKDVSELRSVGNEGWFLDTGTRHFVRFVEDVEAVDIASEGPRYRHDARFAPEGANVNFVSPEDGILKVRTFEKGVEAETLACGTGIVASAVAAVREGLVRKSAVQADSCTGWRYDVTVQARIATLHVAFRTDGGSSFTDVWLEGPVEFIGKVEPDDGLADDVLRFCGKI